MVTYYSEQLRAQADRVFYGGNSWNVNPLAAAVSRYCLARARTRWFPTPDERRRTRYDKTTRQQPVPAKG